MYKALIEELRATGRIPDRQMTLIKKRLNREPPVPVETTEVKKKFPIGKVVLWMIVLVIAVEVGRPYIELLWQYLQY